MTKIDHRAILLLCAAFLLAATFLYPNALNDRNDFLKGFLDNDFLSVLGLITAITIASITSVHLHLTALTEKTNQKFPGTQSALFRSAVSLIYSFTLGVCIVVVKPLLPPDGHWVSFLNVSALIVILFDLSIMLDVTRTALKIPPSTEVNKADERDQC